MRKIFTLLMAIFAMVGTAKAELEVFYKTVWTGNKAISWNNTLVPGESFYTMELKLFGDFTKNHSIKINLNTYSPTYALRYITTNSWEEPNNSEWSVSDGVLSYTPSAEEVEHIKERGIVLSGVSYKVTEIKIGTTSKWTGTKFISWSDAIPGSQFQTSTEGVDFSTLKSGDVINVTVSTYGEPNYTFRYRTSGWEDSEATNLTATIENNVATIAVTDADIASAIVARGLVITGQAYFATAISYGIDIEGETVSNTSTELDWNSSPGKYMDLVDGNKGNLANAQMNDFIRINYTTVASGAYGLQIVNSSWSRLDTESSTTPVYSANEQSFDFQITKEAVLETVRNNGIYVTGKDITVTSVKLLKPADRYDIRAITKTSNELMTYSNSVNLDFSDTGLTPYYASGAETGTVTLTSISTTWNYQGYLLEGDAGTYYPKVVADASASYPSGNLLRGHVGGGTVYQSVYTSYSGDATGEELTNIKTKYRYIFAKEKNGGAETIGFYKLTSDHTLAAHKAYLETDTDITPTGASTRGITLDFGNGTTAIYDVFQDETTRNTTREDNVYYTLQGTRVQNPAKGLYILNGKKVLVK